VAVSDGEGSGVVLDAQGHVLTNNHVISGAGSGGIQVTLTDGRTYAATVVGADPTTDLAVLKLSTVPSGVRPATFGDSSAVKVGDQVMAIGNPLGLSDTVTTGIVSAVNRPVSTASSEGGASGDPSGPFGSGGTVSSQEVVTDAIQTDAAINPGNSGGALLNGSGQVIGITSSIAALGSPSGGPSGGQSGSIGLGFAIPAGEAKNVAGQLLSTGKVQHAYLGVSLRDGVAPVAGAQRRAAVVASVAPGTPAAAAGLATGDAVVAVNGISVDSSVALIGGVRAMTPGQQVTLTTVRGGSTRQVTVTLRTAG
jgi:putative serine protease PepD